MAARRAPFRNPNDPEESFYLENLPQTTDHKTLRQLILQKWKLAHFSKLTDIFLPRRPNAQGKRYGFVRFSGVQDREDMKQSLAKQHIGASPIGSNFARNRREPRNLTGQNSGTYRVVQPKPKELPPTEAQAWPKLKHSAELGTSSVRTKPMSESEQFDFPPIELNIPEENKEWLDRSAIGVLRHVDFLPDLPEMLSEAGWTCKAKILGRGMIWLEFPSKSDCEKALKEKNKKIISIFASLFPWCDTLARGGRTVWVQCVGIPAQAWGMDTFHKIAQSMGSLINVDEITTSRDRLDIARMLILTEHLHIKGTLCVSLNGHNYPVQVHEESMQGVTSFQEWMRGSDPQSEEEGDEEAEEGEFEPEFELHQKNYEEEDDVTPMKTFSAPLVPQNPTNIENNEIHEGINPQNESIADKDPLPSHAVRSDTPNADSGEVDSMMTSLPESNEQNDNNSIPEMEAVQEEEQKEISAVADTEKGDLESQSNTGVNTLGDGPPSEKGQDQLNTWEVGDDLGVSNLADKELMIDFAKKGMLKS